VHHEVLWLNPRLPEGLGGLKLSLRYRGHRVALDITQDTLCVSSEQSWAGPARIGFKGEIYEVGRGQSLRFPLQAAAS
jgi:trehalose/maltose hydrolase-like predicted phosphorylase